MTNTTNPPDAITPMGKNVGAVLFACNLNAVRSAMAELMVKATFPGKIFVDSCGVTPGDPDGFAIAVMAEIGLDMTAHQPKSFDDLDSGFYDVIISFSPEAHAAAEQLTQIWIVRPCIGQLTTLLRLPVRARNNYAPIGMFGMISCGNWRSIWGSR